MIPYKPLMDYTHTAELLRAPKSLVGQTILAIDTTDLGELALLLDDNTLVIITHTASCCESVTIPTIACPVGDLRNLIGERIEQASLAEDVDIETTDEDWGAYARLTLTTTSGTTTVLFRMESDCGYAMVVRPTRYRVTHFDTALAAFTRMRIAA